MRNTWLIIKREYLERVRTRSFIILTLLLPAIMAGFLFAPALLARKAAKERAMVIAASSPELGALVRERLLADKIDIKYRIDVTNDVSEHSRESLRERISKGEIDSFLWLDEQSVNERKVTFVGKSIADFVEKDWIASHVTQSLAQFGLASRGVSAEEVQSLFKRVKVDSLRIDRGQETQGGGIGGLALTFALVMMLYMTILFYGIFVMRAVLEEKTSRVVEVMLSSASARELMTGKIIGVGAVGLTQIIVWMGMVAALGAPSVIAASPIAKLNVTPGMIIGLGGAFLLGYTLYSCLYAAVGAAVNSEQESQQLQIVLTMPLAVSLGMVMPVLRQPDGPVGFWLSMFPLTSPVVMYVRMAVQMPPVWQIALSVAILIATIYGLIWLCSRIYRVGILMYGKKPNLPELLKWLKYAGT